MSLLKDIQAKKIVSKKSLAVLIDPDTNIENIKEVIKLSERFSVDFIFCGGSLVTQGVYDNCIQLIKENCDIPVLIFPGNEMHISAQADAILFLSLVSGRNAEFLIGKHVVSAPFIKKAKLEAIATGYILIDGGNTTTVHYISQTIPIPNNKPDIAAATAIASEMLGQQLIYLDAGSGANEPVSKTIIETVSKSVAAPIIVGGGIDNAEKAYQAFTAGADIVVIGNALEKDPTLLADLANMRNSFAEIKLEV